MSSLLFPLVEAYPSFLILSRFVHDTFGEPYGATGSNQTIFGFTGEPTDDSGLVYLRARYYNPVIGVFPNLDPLEGGMDQPMSLNRYMYAQGNTTNAVDPTGYFPEDESDSENPEKYSYSCRCGWIDWGHVGDSVRIMSDLINDMGAAILNFERKSENTGQLPEKLRRSPGKSRCLLTMRV
jgi:RHS repeat-associated protein